MMIDLNQITGGKLADTLLCSRKVVSARSSPGRGNDGTTPSSSDRPRAVDERVIELSQPNAAAELRLRILELLNRSGPRPSSEIPRSWPVTRQRIRVALGRLIADGLVERTNDGDAAVVRVTSVARRVAAETARNATLGPATGEPGGGR